MRNCLDLSNHNDVRSQTPGIPSGIKAASKESSKSISLLWLLSDIRTRGEEAFYGYVTRMGHEREPGKRT